ncbi:MAG: hypothetical protein QNJ78_13005 [Gammaproteobacteria bacterium]|nr:hypothetical protein [Gammaproteobacteria bacterium]
MHFIKMFITLISTVLYLTGCGSLTLTRDFPVGCGNRSVAIVVEPALLNTIRSRLSRFEADLCTRGYNTLEHNAGFTNSAAVRNYLQSLQGEPERNLIGAILIGDIPHAYQWVTLHSANPSIPDSKEEAISFQYYADLDGVFGKSPDYTSPGGHSNSYDIHSGTVDWEIWIGVLPGYKGDLAKTASAINRYLDKNHDFRTRRLMRPNVFLQVNEHKHATILEEHTNILANMRSGPYSWTPFSNVPDARLYFDSPPGGLTVDQGYSDMQNGLADFMVTDTHGSWGAAGELTIAAVETTPVKTLFYWSNGCAVGDLDHTDNFLASVLYSTTSDVLIAKGTTNDSGGMGNNLNGFFGHNMATALAAKSTYGDAILAHVNVPLIPPWSGDREFHFATVVILGDPTLLRSSDWWEQESYPLDCTSTPKHTVCVRYDDGYIWLVRDSIRRWEWDGAVQIAVGTDARYEHVIGTNSVRIDH